MAVQTAFLWLPVREWLWETVVWEIPLEMGSDESSASGSERLPSFADSSKTVHANAVHHRFAD
jgi:hypothetical protein